MNRPKDLGRYSEHKVVEHLNRNGIQAERVMGSGMFGHLDPTQADDICIPSVENPTYRLEVKRRQSLPLWIWEQLGKHRLHALILDRPHKEPIAVMTIEKYAALLEAAHRDDTVGR